MADTNQVKDADLAVQSVSFVEGFAKDIKDLSELLGLTRKVKKQPGQAVKVYRSTGTLADGNVAEGEDIALSKYKTEIVANFEVTFKKFRKQVTFEAVADKGQKQAIGETDNALLRDVQAGIRKDLFDFIKTGTAKASGANLQKALSQTWAKLNSLWGDYGASDGDFIYFVNPEDAADYLGEANITTQTAFGLSYIENFLGIYNAVVNSQVPKGKVIATAKDNIILVYANPSSSDLAATFNITSDELGLVGIAHNPNYTNATIDTFVVSGAKFYAELIDHVVVASIEAPTPETTTKA